MVFGYKAITHHGRRGRTLVAWALGAALLLLVGCGAADMESAEFGNEAPAGADADAENGEIHRAETNLKQHRVDEARAVYADILDRDPDHGTAAAGLAITDILLLLEMDEVTTLLIEHLGASSGLDANEVVYAEGGYLYWASRGARWTDDGQYDGIANILADELPWNNRRLESVPTFVEGLDEPIHNLIRQLVTVANALRGIDHNLEVALEDDDFTRLYVPGQVFYDDDLTLRLGRSELATIRALIGLVRGAIYFAAAYENDWTLDGALGPWRFDVSLDDPAYVQSFGPLDYTVDYLDRHLLRDVANPDRLSASRLAFDDAIDHARSALRYGLEEPYSTTLQWDELENDDAKELDDVLQALGSALHGPTAIPHATPQPVTFDLSPLFEDDGRTLDDDIPWFVRHTETNQTSPDDVLHDVTELWSVNDDAIDAFWIDGIVDAEGAEDQVSIDIGPDGEPNGFVDVLFGAYLDDVEDVYFSTR